MLHAFLITIECLSRVLKEKQFDNNTAKVQLPEYNALRDSNLRQVAQHSYTPSLQLCAFRRGC